MSTNEQETPEPSNSGDAVVDDADDNDPKEEGEEEEEEVSTRLDVTASTLEPIIEQGAFGGYLHALSQNDSVTTIHLSGTNIDTILTESQTDSLLRTLGNMSSVEELFCFGGGGQSQGGTTWFTEDRLSMCLQQQEVPSNNDKEEKKGLTVLMLWQFARLPESMSLPKALRSLHHLERLTIKLPPRTHTKRKNKQQPYEWGCMDVYAMAWASMPRLKALQCKCVPSVRAREPILSPEGFRVLLTSPTIETLYLENCGLMDEHIDIMVEELPGQNHVLQAMDLQENQFTDDALYSTGQLLEKLAQTKNASFKSLNLSGIHPITAAGGQALVQGLAQNRTLQHFELEGTAARFADEFAIPASPHADADWHIQMDMCLRLNRAYGEAPRIDTSNEDFCKALNSVSDHTSCLFHVLRHHLPKYVRGSGGAGCAPVVARN